MGCTSLCCSPSISTVSWSIIIILPLLSSLAQISLLVVNAMFLITPGTEASLVPMGRVVSPGCIPPSFTLIVAGDRVMDNVVGVRDCIISLRRPVFIMYSMSRILVSRLENWGYKIEPRRSSDLRGSMVAREGVSRLRRALRGVRLGSTRLGRVRCCRGLCGRRFCLRLWGRLGA